MGRKKHSEQVSPPSEGEGLDIFKSLIDSVIKRTVTQEQAYIDYIPTGVVPFDFILGGFPVGHISLLGGMPGSGKTLLILHAVASHLERGYSCLYIDAEGSITEQRLASVGIPLEALERKLFIRSYVVLEDCLSDVKTLLWRLREEGNDKPFLIVIDSFPSLLPHKWSKEGSDEGFIADLAVGGYARSGTAFLAGLPSLLQATRSALVITTQARSDISMGGRGSPVKLFKFFALEHLSHLVLFLGVPEILNPPFVMELEDGGEKLVGLRGAYSKVKITLRKVQLNASVDRVLPPHFDFSLFYPIVDIPKLSVKAGRVDNIFSILTYASLPSIGVVERVVKPGVGTVFYYRKPQEGKVIQFSYVDAYTNSEVRELVLGEIKDKLGVRIHDLLQVQVKGRPAYREEGGEGGF